MLWNIRHCRPSHRLTGHHGGVFGVELDQQALTAYTASGDKRICQWEVETGQCLRVVVAGREPLMSLHWNNGYLATSCGALITLWRADTLERLGEFKGHDNRVESVQLRVYGEGPVHGTLLSACQDKTIKYWDVKSTRCVRTLQGHDSKISSAVCDEVVIVSADQTTLRIWDFHPHKTSKR